MSKGLATEDFAYRARRHREVAKLSMTADLVKFHDDLALRLEQLAEASRVLFRR